MKIKNTLRVLTCLLLVLVFTIALASCDKIEGIFHKHSYTHTVTLPTCKEQGYTTHTCECGDSYIDGYVPVNHELVVRDAKAPTCTEPGNAEYFTCRKCDYTTYEPIAPLGHSYEEKITRFPTTAHDGIFSKICSECGDTIDEEIDSISVTLPRVSEFIHSFIGMNKLSINADNTEIIFIDELKDVEGDEKRFIAIDLTRFELNGEGDDLYARITFAVGIASVDPTAQGADPVFDTQLLVDVIAYGDDVSVSVTEDGGVTESEIDLTEQFYGYIAENFGMTYDELAEAYYLVEKLADYLPVVEGVIDWLSNIELPDDALGFDGIYDLIFDEVITVDEDGYYHFNLADLAAVIESIQDRAVSEIIDTYFGKGTTVKLEAFMLTVPMMKVKTLAKSAEAIAETYDIPLDEVYSLINYVVYIATGEDFNLEREIKIRYNKTVAEVIIELTNQDNKEITDGDINMMALALVNEIKNIFDQTRKYTVDQMYNLYTYDDPNFEYSVTDDIISTLVTMGDSFNAVWHYSEDGEIDSLEMGLLGVVSIGYEITDKVTVSNLKIFLEDGTTVSASALTSETGATFALYYDEYEIISFAAEYDAESLLSASFKLNALYIGKLEGYETEENLVNVITYTFLKGENETFTARFVLNLISQKAVEGSDEKISTLENAIDLFFEFDGVDTLVITGDGKVTTVVISGEEGNLKYDVEVKKDEDVIADYTVNTQTTVDEFGYVTEAHVTVLGTIEGSDISAKLDFADRTLTATVTLDGKETINALLTLDEDGNVVADIDLDGLNVTTEIIRYVKEIIEIVENLGVLEELPELTA